MSPKPHTPDIVKVVAGTIVFTVVFSLVTAAVFGWEAKDVPVYITDSGKVAFGALSMILTNVFGGLGGARRADDVPKVQIDQPQDEPILTKEVEEEEK